MFEFPLSISLSQLFFKVWKRKVGAAIEKGDPAEVKQ